jgi:pyocin large subunit-like protein
LWAHYEKHGREFGAITIEEYLSRAKSFRDRPAGGAVLEIIRPDGIITRFDRNSGDFIAFNPNGVIRTFFRPTAGEAYFRRQGRERR